MGSKIALKNAQDQEFSINHNDNAGAISINSSDISLKSQTESEIAPYNKGFKNYIIDGRFDFWYEGATQTISGFGSDTMWYNYHIGSTKTHSQQIFSTGSVFPDGTRCPNYFSRTIVASVAGANNLVSKSHAIEDVSRLAGKTVTISFYAKADSAKSIWINLSQEFGTGGTPSSPTYTSAGAVSLTTSWQKFTKTVTIPSISGKTIGANGNHTTATRLIFYFDIGSNIASASNTIGGIQQSGTFDIAMVQLEEGSVATTFENRPIGLEQVLIGRYYQHHNNDFYVYGVAAYSGATVTWQLPLPVLMRVNPVFVGGWHDGVSAAGGAVYANTKVISTSLVATQLGTNYAAFLNIISVDARL